MNSDLLELAGLRKRNAERRERMARAQTRLNEVSAAIKTATLAEMVHLSSEMHTLSDVLEQVTRDVAIDDLRIEVLARRLG